MARKRRPSIALIVLFIILLLLYFFAASIVEFVSNWSGQGSFTYSYLGGEEAIVSIKYDLPQDLADAMVLKQTNGWTASIESNTISLTGGTLNPGETVTIDYRLKHYIAGGTKTVKITSTTSGGQEISSQTNLLVQEMVLLSIVGIIYQNAIWTLILALIVLVCIIVLFLVGEKKEKEKEKPTEAQAQNTPVSS